MRVLNTSFIKCILIFICLGTGCIAGNRPCLMRAIPGESVVCVCNDTYCDNIVREAPDSDKYIAYTSSKGGSRFKRSKGIFKVYSKANVSLTLELDPETTYQSIEGFGGAVTDAAGINWMSMSEALQEYLIESYFSAWGLQYNMLRVPIGGCDFSTRSYAYNEQPKNDVLLSNYTLADEDYEFKIPMIKAAMAASSTPIHIVATTWSPPPWMKTNNMFSGKSALKQEYYQTYADYHYKFIEEYGNEDIPIWGITTTNEPSDSILSFIKINDLGWTPDTMGAWIENNLGPTIRNSKFKNLKILAVDDQRPTIPTWFNEMLQKHPKAIEYVDGVGVHYYLDDIASPTIFDLVTNLYPGKFILGTEASEGSFPWQKKVVLGSWDRAVHYILDIITDLNYNLIGWIDWNLCLDKRGGPNWVSNFVDSPIIVFPEKMEFVKQPMFYAMGHFSKFIPRGSRRIKVTEDKDPFTMSADNVAFLTPDKNIVLVIYNNHNDTRKIGIRLNEKQAFLSMEPHSVTTVEFEYKEWKK